MGGVDVEKAQLVRAGRVIGAGGIHGIARIAQIDEVHTLDHAAIGDIEAGDDTDL